MQEQFYREVICDRDSPHRYWILEDDTIEGMGGITNIQWENRLGEISLLIRPESRGKGYGEKAVELLLDQAFNHLNLKTVYGECYACNRALTFWAKIIGIYNAYETKLPARKYLNDVYCSSLYFSIDADEYRKVHPLIWSA
jgi:RimJ/RimL family protein N-acetyltransferase